jgi:hypothetical protein
MRLLKVARLRRPSSDKNFVSTVIGGFYALISSTASLMAGGEPEMLPRLVDAHLSVESTNDVVELVHRRVMQPGMRGIGDTTRSRLDLQWRFQRVD